MKKKQLLIVLAIVVVLALAGTAYYYRRHKKTALAEPTPKAAEEDAPLQTAGSSSSGLGSVLLVGSSVALPASVLPTSTLPTSVLPASVPPASVLVTSIVAGDDVRAAKIEDRSPDSTPIIAIDTALSGVGAVETAGFPLKPGSTGPEVAELQTYLVRNYGVGYPEGITSQFDGATVAAVRRHLHRDSISRNFYNKMRKSLGR